MQYKLAISVAFLSYIHMSASICILLSGSELIRPTQCDWS